MKRTILVSLIAAVAIVGVVTVMASIGKAGKSAAAIGCLPTTLDSIGVGFPVRQPSASSLPAGYDLEGVDTSGGAVIMFYADHSLCPNTESFDGLIQKGAIVITANKSDQFTDSTSFQDTQLQYFANHTETIAQVLPVTINGNKGAGWEPFVGSDTTTIDGKIINQEPVNMPGRITFFDDKDATIYAFTARQSLDRLEQIAESMY